jgi:hypothetical protein
LAITDVSGQAIGPIFRGQLKDQTDRLSQNVGNYQSRLRNIPEEGISQANNYLASGRETLLLCGQIITRNQQHTVLNAALRLLALSCILQSTHALV